MPLQTKGTDTVNWADFIDANVLPVLALSGQGTLAPGIDWRMPIQYVQRTFAQTLSSGGLAWQGFGLVPADPGYGISWEATAKTVAAMEQAQQSSAVFASRISRFTSANCNRTRASVHLEAALGWLARRCPICRTRNRRLSVWRLPLRVSPHEIAYPRRRGQLAG